MICDHPPADRWTRDHGSDLDYPDPPPTWLATLLLAIVTGMITILVMIR